MANHVRAFSAFGANVFNYRTSLDVGALASHEHGKPSAIISRSAIAGAEPRVSTPTSTNAE